MVSGVMSFGKP